MTRTPENNSKVIACVADKEAMIQENIKDFALQDAVRAYFQQGRAFSEHWAYYMNAEQYAQFGNNVARFNDECRKLYRYMTS